MTGDGVRRGQVVADASGNHFLVLSTTDKEARLESVATREVFVAPVSELRPTDREAF